MKRNWKQILGVVAPVAAQVIGGPLGAIASKAVAIGLGLAADATEADIEKAVIEADPSQLAKLRQIDADLQRDLEQAEIDWKALDVKDRDSARKRQIALKDRAPAILAAVATTGFFGVLGGMFVLDIPADAVQPLDIMLGGLIVMVGKVFNFYFGSSAGSAKKNDIIADLKGGRRG